MARLVWFRNNLRLRDNPALVAACQSGEPVVGLYLDCPAQWARHHMAPIQQEYRLRHVQSLMRDAAERGIPFLFETCQSFSDVPERLAALVDAHDVTAIHAQREFLINEVKRDQAVSEQLAVPLHLHTGDCVIDPGRVLTGSGDMFKVFTPFSRAWLKILAAENYEVLGLPKACGDAVETNLPDVDDSLSGDWPVGEDAAIRQLRQFCRQAVLDYKDHRDFPARRGTSFLSPWLAMGVISPRQCLARLEAELGHLPMGRGEPGFTWMNEIIWREFYRHVIHAWPALCKHEPFKPETKALQWSDDEAAFEAWCTGQTGFPIVDAAMRCLHRTGWMHNRLRMIVASFLCKDLHIDWHRGEQWFMSQLIDGDFASNNGGWQWAAGTGADAAPYFRVFNPTTQGTRFDPEGEFVRQWVPELVNVPNKHVHEPAAWLATHEPGNAYPQPIVDHAIARKHAIDMFAALK